MEKFDFDLSLKNIPIPPQKTFLKQMIDKTENFVSRVRRATDVYLFPEKYKNPKPSYGFKSSRTAPKSDYLKPFEDDLYNLIANLEFNEYRSGFQRKMAEAVDYINKSNKVFMFGDKTTNIYEVSPETHDKLLLDNITKDYVQVANSKVDEVNDEAREIAIKLDLADRVERMSVSPAFITIKDHKDRFETDTKCRLINPAKSQIGIISRLILQRVNNELRLKLKLNQWQSTQDVLKWFSGIKGKGRKAFMQWDIKEYYPSISKPLLDKAIDFAIKNDVEIEDHEADIIRHSRKAFLFSKGTNDETITWQKSTGEFDVTMGAPDGAEVCELVGIFILNEVNQAFPRLDFGLYRDDGLAVHGRIPKRELELTQQKIRGLFQRHGLEVIFENPHNSKVVNFLDVTLDLTNESHKPYRKPNDRPLYVHVESNHPQSVIKQIPKGINKRLSNISSSKEHFDRAAPAYQKALDESGHKYKLKREDPQSTIRGKPQGSARQRQKRKIIYFTPPFNKALKTKVGRCFLEMVRKHFPPHHVLHPILNKNTLKVSYSCTANIKKIIQAHNKKVLKRHKRRQSETNKKCNCQKSKREKCPLRGHCNRRNVVYKATTPGPNPQIYCNRIHLITQA